MACLSAAYARKGLLARAHSQRRRRMPIGKGGEIMRGVCAQGPQARAHSRRRRRMPIGKGGDSTNETDLGYFWDEKKSRNADSGARYRDGFAL